MPFSNQPSNHNLHDGQAVNFPPESLKRLSTLKELHRGRGWQQNEWFSRGTNRQRTVCDHSSACCVASTTESSHPVSLNMVHWDLVILCKADPGNLCQCFVCIYLNGWLTPSLIYTGLPLPGRKSFFPLLLLSCLDGYQGFSLTLGTMEQFGNTDRHM